MSKHYRDHYHNTRTKSGYTRAELDEIKGFTSRAAEYARILKEQNKAEKSGVCSGCGEHPAKTDGLCPLCDGAMKTAYSNTPQPTDTEIVEMADEWYTRKDNESLVDPDNPNYGKSE